MERRKVGVKSSDRAAAPLVPRPPRREREQKILIELVDHYIKTGKPVGSHSLQDESLLKVSSATIRNYFASLEVDGYVKQQHTSGGRIPEAKAYSVYAAHCLDELQQPREGGRQHRFQRLKEEIVQEALFTSLEPTEVVSSIQAVTAYIAKKSCMSAVAVGPRFDQDSVSNIQFAYIDSRRVLAIIVTEFGLVHTSVIVMSGATLALVKKAELFCRGRLFDAGGEAVSSDDPDMGQIRALYQEAMSSYFVMYSNISSDDIFRSGFSHLFSYPEFQDGAVLRPAISLFENSSMLRGLFRETVRANRIRYWIGKELEPYSSEPVFDLALISAPYHVAGKPVGALGLVGPMRVPYREIFSMLSDVAEMLSHLLTHAFVKHRVSFRMPEMNPTRLSSRDVLALEFQKNTVIKRGAFEFNET